MTRPRRKRLRPSQRRKRRVRVAGVYMDASQVRAALDRVDVRMLSLKRDMAAHLATNDPLREDFSAFYQRWFAFYTEASDDWLAWGSNVDEAESFDTELDAFRVRYEDATGRLATSPTTSATSRRSAMDSVTGALKAVGVVLAIGAIGAVLVAREVRA